MDPLTSLLLFLKSPTIDELPMACENDSSTASYLLGPTHIIGLQMKQNQDHRRLGAARGNQRIGQPDSFGSVLRFRVSSLG